MRHGGAITSTPPLLKATFEITPGRKLPHLVFSRQLLPNAQLANAESIRAWAGLILEAVAGVLPDDQPWSLHVEPHYHAAASHRVGARAWHSAQRAYPSGGTKSIEQERRDPRFGTRSSAAPAYPEVGDADAGRHRCRLIREALIELLRKKRRHLLRRLRPGPAQFTESDSLVQLLLTTPDTGFLSVAVAPLPLEQRHLISPFPKGELPVASDKAAPSRAFAKLAEATLRLGRSIKSGETCVDLGASPGSWTYVAANCGARVVAVDRSPLREDLLRHPRVEFQPGDAFRFKPERPVDWLLCDVIAAPERTAKLLLDWLRRGWCRRFVVTLKLKDSPGVNALALLKQELPPLTQELFLIRLCANKKEACAFGWRE